MTVPFPGIDSFMNLKAAFPNRLRIYVAGPYTNGDVVVNVRRAVQAADYITTKLGHIAFCPHLTHFWHMIEPHPVEFWYKYDLEWLKVCNAVYRIEGYSLGADSEVAWAYANHLPVYYRLDEIPKAGE